jgi:cytochrome c oxidase subunit 3
MTNLTRSNFQAHPFHLVSPSPWPLYTCIALLTLTTSGVSTMHGFSNADTFLILAFLSLISSMTLWWRDVISEGTYLGNHTLAVQRGLNMGVALFIVSEALFFLAIFWAFFHSALSPTVELGAQWPPMGIEAINPFELPLLNTVILLSSGVTVTYAHHSLIQGNRSGALYGLVATVILAIVFTGFQGVEYTVSSFTISDGAFGSCFYFGTGFHGLTTIICVAPFINTYKLKTKTITLENNNVEINNNVEMNNNNKTNNLLITMPSFNNKESESYFLEKNFLEWFVGFTDAEGNFNIKLSNLNNNTFKRVQFTFQIGLHEDDREVLSYIMNTLKCGHISKSKGRVNFFVNDLNSLLHIIIPIFDYVNLNSSKYYHFELFKKAVFLTKDKSHLLDKGRLEIINYRKEMQMMSDKWVPNSMFSIINITNNWLAGFIDGDGSFSYNKYVPRFKLENHCKELELYYKIKEFISVGNTLLTSPRVNRVDNNSTVVLEINKIKELKDNLIPLMYKDDCLLLRTQKSKDFLLWLKLIDIYYKGYHTIIEGKYIFDAIKLHINRYRLTTNITLLENMKILSVSEIDNLLVQLYLLDSPYEIKQGIRYYRNTDKLVSESTSIVVIDSNNNKTIYSSFTECAKSLYICRKTIKNCLNTGRSYKGYIFVLS